MMRRKRELEEAAEEAVDLLWYARHVAGGRCVEGEAHACQIELHHPEAVAAILSGEWEMDRLRGRVEALRWVAWPDLYLTFDAEGIRDT